MTLGLLVLLKVIRIKIPIDFQYDLSLEARKKWELTCGVFCSTFQNEIKNLGPIKNW